ANSYNTYEYGNPKNLFNTECGNPENFFDFEYSNPENFFDFECSNPENFLNLFKPKDASFLDIYQYSNPENFINTEPKNPKNFFGTLESENEINLFNMLMSDCPEAYYEQINNENDFEIIEDNNEKIQFPLELEMSFNNWAELDKWLDNHGLESGFAFTITHSEKDKEDKIP
ncbi:45397_t:CDS:2, partial [Gigaspora margarita]